MKHVLGTIAIGFLKTLVLFLMLILYVALKFLWLFLWLCSFLVGQIGMIVSGVVVVFAIVVFIFSGFLDGLKVVGLLAAVLAFPYIAEGLLEPLDEWIDRVFSGFASWLTGDQDI